MYYRDVEMVELHASKDGVCDMRITSKSIEAPVSVYLLISLMVFSENSLFLYFFFQAKSSPPGIKVSQVGETLKVDIEQGSQWTSNLLIT